MVFQNFLFKSYWLSQPAMARPMVALTWWLILGGLFIIGIVFWAIERKRPDLASRVALKRFSECFIICGGSGLVLFFFRQSQVYFLAWRIWFLVWFIALLIWLLPIVIYSIRRIPQIKAEKLDRMRREQYLPKRKS